MVQLKIVSGKMAGTEQVVRHFPFRIGRSPSSNFCLEDDGVWDEHLELSFDSINGFVATTQPNARASINGYPIEAAILRNGDSIELGAARIRFWLSETRQSSLGLREWITWVGIAVVTGVQVGLVYWLVK